MLNRYPLWKNLMVILVVAIGALYSLPNIYGEDPAVQISGTRGQQADTTALTEVQNVLKENNLPTKSIVLENGSILARFNNTDDQLLAKDKIAEKLGNNYTTALNLAPIQFTAIKNGDKFGTTVTLENADQMSKAARIIRQLHPTLDVSDIGDNTLNLALSEAALTESRNLAIEQNLTILRKRVAELGVAEAVIQRQGAERIVIELPGVQDTARAKEILGATATLEFRIVNSLVNPESAARGMLPKTPVRHK